MANFRVFVEKQAQYNVEAQQLLNDLKQNLHLQNLTALRVINIYDVFNLERQELIRAQHIVFAEAPVDLVSEQMDLAGLTYLALEPLPGQYDQRADSALQALNLLGISSSELELSTGKLLIFSGISADELVQIRNYYLNPLEMCEKDLAFLAAPVISAELTAIPHYVDFRKLDAVELEDFRRIHGLAMTTADLHCIQTYFQTVEQRDPTETEIRVLDTYWSDHCRHTTFETQISSVEVAEGKYQALIQQTYQDYLNSREQVYAAKLAEKPVCLMDLATICAKQFRQQGKLADVEFSAEINACSLFVDVPVNGQNEVWSLQFKNETHNHPTEIEPYGGASTCVGGAIRDPLSGRAYVYQAMRISGASNPLEAIEATLPGKLSQRKISTRAAQGFSGYGNQIGLATTHVSEIYHPGYQAKRMEVGMVVAAAPYANIRREVPAAGDAIILIGGRTGRDGCGGATGSSKEHDSDSARLCGAEVQKGNPVVERKIQRLFRNPDLTRLIKRCNDFGAGGVSVAIGELADGIQINLDLVPTKYHGLSGTELAISESQERMAVVVAAADAHTVIELASAENLEAVQVAEVSATPRVQMHWRGQIIVDLARDFLNTNGARAVTTAQIANPNLATYADANVAHRATQNEHLAELLHAEFFSRLEQQLVSLQGCSQQGMIDMFDATIGASTILMPYGGKYQLTPSQVSVQKLPVVSAENDVASIASFAFDPYLSSLSHFHGAYFAVVESVAKIVAAGADHRRIKFSFQEYFEKLANDPLKWGKPLAALLGAYRAQQGFALAAIGGKDSMSGTFNQLSVPPTLISFAVAPTLASQIISPELKAPGELLYAYCPPLDSNDVLDLSVLDQQYQRITQLIAAGQINAATAIGSAGIASSLSKMAFGNQIGFEIATPNAVDLFAANYAGLVYSASSEINEPNHYLIGRTIAEPELRYAGQSRQLPALVAAWQGTLNSVFPLKVDVADSATELLSLAARSPTNPTSSRAYAGVKLAQPRVLIPVFPGTNCEYDSQRAFDAAGAASQIMVFNNLSPAHIEQSLVQMAQLIEQSQILMLPGGFSAGDEPDGSAKFIATILQNQRIQDAVHQLLARDGLILGICNGFQALVKSGLLPYGEIRTLDSQAPTLTYNVLGRHISRLASTKIVANHSPWLNSFTRGEIHQVAMSHGEGRLVASTELLQQLFSAGQVACQYVDLNGQPTMDGEYNPNGSLAAIEALTSLNGRILGKMGHSERKGSNLYKNISGVKEQDIFANGVRYFN